MRQRISVISRNYLKNCFENYLKNKKTSFSYCIEKLDLLSPLKTLQRGYIISKKNDAIIKSVKDLHTDDTITLVYADGKKRSHSEVGDDMAEKTYEEAMARLDEIINLLENNEASLDRVVDLL